MGLHLIVITKFNGSEWCKAKSNKFLRKNAQIIFCSMSQCGVKLRHVR